MTVGTFEAKFYETYYVANIISEVLKNPFPYAGKFEEYFGDDKIQCEISSFPKETIFHGFIDNLIEDLWYEALEKHIENYNKILEPPIIQIFKYHAVNYYDFSTFEKDYKSRHDNVFNDDLYMEYYTILIDNDWYGVKNQIKNETFYILFQNRELLRDFHELISSYIRDLRFSDIDPLYRKYFRKDGVIKRFTIPKWVKKAVYFRDRGRCTICKCDLSGILSLSEKLNYDHVVPIVKGGTNEVTNIQLLCEKCNKSKGGRNTKTSNVYELWY